MPARTRDLLGVLFLGLLVLVGFLGGAMLISGPNPDFFARTFDVASPYGSLIHRDVVMAVRLFSSLCVAAGLFAILALAFPGRLMKFAEWAREKTQSGLTRRRGVICVAVFLVLFSAIAYAGAFRIGFHSDDFAWMESTEKTTQDPGHIFSLSQSHFFRPVTFLYHTVNFNLFRKNPYALHISGVALHGLAALFIFLVALQLSDRVYLAITAALLFAAYPVSSRSVMWISGSEIVFAGLIYLSAFYLFLLYLDRKKLAYYILSLILFIFGVMAKEAVISLALATFLAGFLLSKRASRWSGLPFVVVAVFFIFFLSAFTFPQKKNASIPKPREKSHPLRASASAPFSGVSLRVRWKYGTRRVKVTHGTMVTGRYGVALYRTIVSKRFPQDNITGGRMPNL